MEDIYIPESGRFLEDIMELQKRDKETYDFWEGKRNRSLKQDHQENLAILKDELNKAISKRRWVVKTLPNGDISIDKGDRPGGVVYDNTGNEVKTLLGAYLGVLRGLRG